MHFFFIVFFSIFSLKSRYYQQTKSHVNTELKLVFTQCAHVQLQQSHQQLQQTHYQLQQAYQQIQYTQQLQQDNIQTIYNNYTQQKETNQYILQTIHTTQQIAHEYATSYTHLKQTQHQATQYYQQQIQSLYIFILYLLSITSLFNTIQTNLTHFLNKTISQNSPLHSLLLHYIT